ncbi:MAG TPA: hypothetical protein VMZ29_07420 [Candidatus Bathyarchaeia archaeon]|nr:hypothetical protein [Candidatus Bathyarchaeia archaeon]
MSEQPKTYSVLIIDNFYFDPDEDYIVEGFSTVELAIEYARRIIRASIEHHRKPNQKKEELSKLWHLFGENATVLGFHYRGSDELGFFINNLAKPNEIDWKEIAQRAGI